MRVVLDIVQIPEYNFAFQVRATYEDESVHALLVDERDKENATLKWILSQTKQRPETVYLTPRD